MASCVSRHTDLGFEMGIIIHVTMEHDAPGLLLLVPLDVQRDDQRATSRVKRCPIVHGSSVFTVSSGMPNSLVLSA